MIDMKMVLVIDGESANELFAVGVKDLANFFLPRRMNIKTKDIKRLWFEELRRDGKEITEEKSFDGREYCVIKDKDNIYNRDEKK